MKKYIYAMFAIAILLFIAGCAEEAPQEKVVKAFIGGTQGLKIQFTESAPPDVVFDRAFPFAINIKLENVGEWDITNPADATVTIIGIDPAEFGKTAATMKADSPIPLIGSHYDAQGNVMPGTITTVDFPDLQYQKEVVGQIELPIVARVCYDYGTKAVSKICILQDLLGVTRKPGEKPVCEPSETKQILNSGAPVQVTSLTQTATATDKITLSFTIAHKGAGSVSQQATECSSDIAKKERVYVKVDTGIPGLTCSGLEGAAAEGFTTLYAGTRTIVCTQPLPATRSDYEKPISIELSYGYLDQIGKTITVKHAGS